MDKQCATARAPLREISKLRSALVCVCFVYKIYAHLVCYTYIRCLVHGARTRAVFQLLCVHVHFAEGGEKANLCSFSVTRR